MIYQRIYYCLSCFFTDIIVIQNPILLMTLLRKTDPWSTGAYYLFPQEKELYLSWPSLR